MKTRVKTVDLNWHLSFQAYLNFKHESHDLQRTFMVAKKATGKHGCVFNLGLIGTGLVCAPQIQESL